MTLDYSQIESQLVERLPELLPAIERYWQLEGKPGADAGPYILFEDLFRPYIGTLLASPSSQARDTLLRRAFNFAEECIQSGGDLHDLAGIAVFEGQRRAWFESAESFMGAQSRYEARLFDWPDDDVPGGDPGSDLYDVRGLVQSLLGEPGVRHGAT